ARGVLPGSVRPARPRADRRAQGRAADARRAVVEPAHAAQRLPLAPAATAAARAGGPDPPPAALRQAPCGLPRRRLPARGGRGPRIRAPGGSPGGFHADGSGRVRSVSAGCAAHAGHARHGVRQLRRRLVGSAARLRRALRRPRHRQARRLRSTRQHSPHRYRPGGDREEQGGARQHARRHAPRARAAQRRHQGGGGGRPPAAVVRGMARGVHGAEGEVAAQVPP
ncbi:unnamed protein product, partial [Closterium sp. NIES-54]